MYSAILNLGSVTLTGDKLIVCAGCTVSFQVPYFFSTLDYANVLQAFKSGHIYTNRGIGCSLDIKIFSDGQRLDTSTRDAFVQKLGGHLRDNQIWTCLGLVPGFDADTVLSSFEPDISISLRHGQPQLPQKPGSRTRALEKTDLNCPKDVCQAEFNGIYLELNFLRVHEPKPGEEDTGEHSQSKNLEVQSVDKEKKIPHHLNDFELAVKDLKGAISKINSASLLISIGAGQAGLNTLKITASTLKNGPGLARYSRGDPTSIAEVSEPVANKKKFSEETRTILKMWLQTHASNPYPTAVEKQELMGVTGLTRRQITTWFINTRKKLKNTSLQQDAADMLFLPVLEDTAMSQQDEEEMLLSYNNLSEDDVDLLSELREYDMSRFSETTIVSTTTSLSQSTQETTIQAAGKINFELNFSAVSKLIDGALQIFIGGYYKNISLPPDVKLEKPAPEICLARLVPNMFNPGYREIMAFNNRFLPRISQFTANPLPEHLQPPRLREKMQQLEAMSISPIPGYETTPSINAIEHRTRVCETRLFVMMQRTLYDATATRKVWKKAKNELAVQAPQDSDSDPELLDLDQDNQTGSNEWDELLTRLTSDEEFNDLLLGDEENDDDDLLDEAERERLEIERGMEEMLFGDGGYRSEDDDDDHYFLSGGESDGDNMLV